MSSLRSWLQGKKSYIVTAATIAGTVAGMASGVIPIAGGLFALAVSFGYGATSAKVARLGAALIDELQNKPK